MAEKSTWIKIDRNILDWRWFKDSNTLQVFLWLLLSANIKPNGFMGVDIQRGEVATSYPSIARATGLTENQVRTAIKHLKRTGEITGRIYPKFSVFSIVNYASYQDTITGNFTGKSQAKHRQSTGTSQQSKNVRMEECKNIPAFAPEESREWEDELNVEECFRGRFENAEAYLAFRRG